MYFIRQKIHWEAILGQIGLLLHVPAVMAALTLVIALIFKEDYAYLPFGSLAVSGIAIGQLFYRLSKKAERPHLWDAMIIAGLGWLLCSFTVAIPIYWIAQFLVSQGNPSELLIVFSQPTNALFEAFSGFTSTGLTMMQGEGFLPYTLQWWRSFLEWVGGLGLVVFILALTHLNKEGYQLYYAEARSEQMSKNITGTAHWIWGLYSAFTSLSLLLFLFGGMPFWEALNHALTVISTGGFTLTNSSFEPYSTTLQIMALFMMLLGAISFGIHYRVIREGHFSVFWKSAQIKLLFILAIGGGLLLILLDLWNKTDLGWMHPYFQWISALTTCGFSSTGLEYFSPMAKLFLIMGMFIGGTTGSTAGGIKLRRLLYIVAGVFLRIVTMTRSKENQITEDYQEVSTSQEEPPGIDLPPTEKSERLFTAGVLFTLWTSTLFFGWFLILRWTPKGGALNALFDVTSAMSNVGLSSGLLTPDFSTIGKWVFMFLMWVGRLEIIPVLILLLTLPMIFKRRQHHGK
ncbi:MAG: TrkH family potassium uptake protein [Chlamydiia bacterium]|nr:TrkH family potassium uptake protein [Chlamydiia bacterium]